MTKETKDTYSSVMRDLNKKDPAKAIEFAKAFKKAFDDALDAEIENHQNVALLQAKKTIASKEDRLLKLAQAMMTPNRNPQEVGSSLAKVIKVLVDRLPYDRQISLKNIREKISKLDPNEIYNFNKNPFSWL